MNRRERMLVTAALVAAALAAGAWGGARLMAAADAAAAEARDLAECERLAERIATARGETQPASPGSRDPGEDPGVELSRRIEAAALAAGLSQGVGSIEPGSPRRLGEGPFVERPATVHLRGAGLREVFTFLHGLLESDRRFGLKSIRLVAPPGNVPVNAWDVEATLACTTYSPRGRPGHAGAAAVLKGMP